MAVLLLNPHIARTGRMTAVYFVIVAIYGNLVVMRCVAHLGDAAVEIPTDSRPQTGDTRELIAGVLDLFLVRSDADIRLALLIITQTGLHSTTTVCAAKVDAVIVLQQRDVLPVAARRQLIPVDLGLIRAVIQRQHCSRGTRRIEVHLLEALDILRRVHALHIQRVARDICLRTADNLVRNHRAVNIDRVVLRRRTVAARNRVDGDIADRDRIAGRVAECLATNNIAYRAARNRDDVACSLAVYRDAAKNILFRTALNKHLVFRHVSIRRETAVDILIRCRTALDIDFVVYGFSTGRNTAKNGSVDCSARERNDILLRLAFIATVSAIDRLVHRTTVDINNVTHGISAI